MKKEQHDELPSLSTEVRNGVIHVLHTMQEKLDGPDHASVCESRFLPVIYDEEIDEAFGTIASLIDEHILAFGGGHPLSAVLTDAVLQGINFGYELARSGVVVPPLSGKMAPTSCVH